MSKLVILSHTEHYVRNGEIVGWGPTIREINELTQLFDQIVHIACLHDGDAPESCIPYQSNAVTFIDIPPFGGRSFGQKLSTIKIFPGIIKIFNKERKDADWTQVRLPTGFGVLLLPYLWITKRTKKLWVKYAGNWKQENAPFGYRIQRWWLRSNLLNVPVTINGVWDNQASHLLSFENPCLNNMQIQEGQAIQMNKDFSPPFNFTFIGKLFESKGLMAMLEALAMIDISLLDKIHIIGEGEDKAKAEEFCKQKDLPAIFHGFLAYNEVHNILKKTHFIVLPSKSEGFPKVLAEGAAYGAIPIASAVSAIPHYFTDNESGYLWWLKEESFSDRVLRIPFKDEQILTKVSRNASEIALKFTFQSYMTSLKEKIFGN